MVKSTFPKEAAEKHYSFLTRKSKENQKFLMSWWNWFQSPTP
jgi:hypothetical protein